MRSSDRCEINSMYTIIQGGKHNPGGLCVKITSLCVSVCVCVFNQLIFVNIMYDRTDSTAHHVFTDSVNDYETLKTI